ncbi:AAA family ATPase [Nocardioides sp. zg-1230]|uniref:ATP-binding protein n=1 Tax=Nocardioides sp. zg-1230 TaxID=2736601 RepID=UPI003463E519
MNLVGRRAEREAVEALLEGARTEGCRVLVVRGEAGIGKTALLEQARARAAATGFRVESSTGIESESQFAFGGLHQLCLPLLDRLDALPAPQQAALNVAFGQQAGPAPDRFLLGLAVLNLLAEVAEDGPLLCLVDDAQWLDEGTAQVLAFVARRLSAERVALLVFVRDPTEDGDLRPFRDLPDLRLEGLGAPDARELLAAAVRTPLDEVVRERIIGEARGNPLALLELPRSVATTQWAGGFGLPDTMSVPHRVEDAFRARSDTLPAETRLLLLVAASEPTGEAELLRRAAAELGIADGAADLAEAAGLVTIDTRVRFRHPLVRSAVYRAAPPPDRRRAHRALAQVTDPRLDPDRRAWHSAQAALGVDEAVASQLEQSAGRARARGGLAAAAAFLEQAAELTPEPASRARRALDAALAKHDAGASEAARELLTVAAAGPLDALQHARVDLLAAQIAFHLSRDTGAPRMLLAAAQALAPLDALLARETYLHALDAAFINGGDVAVDIAKAAASTAPAPGPANRPVDQLLNGLATILTRGFVEGAPALRHALESFRDVVHEDPRQRQDSDRWLWLAARNAVGVLDDELVHVLAVRNVDLAREAGALASLPAALGFLSITSVLEGDLVRAGELAAEATALTADTGGVPLHHVQLILNGWRGDEEKTAALVALLTQDDTYSEEAGEAFLSQYALAVLHNGRGSYSAAQQAAARACESHESSLSSASLPELVEAGARSGDRAVAAAALEELSLRAETIRTPWALGLAARSRALMTAGPGAEEHYREALGQLDGCRMKVYLARTHLVYGEWLRRENRRQDARDELRTAHELLTGMGTEAFAARAARELRATGEHPRKRAANRTDALTAQEKQIARLVATGATSREVAAELFLSPRTIEAHLRSIFRKLDITSRRQLRDVRLT